MLLGALRWPCEVLQPHECAEYWPARSPSGPFLLDLNNPSASLKLYSGRFCFQSAFFALITAFVQRGDGCGLESAHCAVEHSLVDCEPRGCEITPDLTFANCRV